MVPKFFFRYETTESEERDYLREQRATFVMAPREMSRERLLQIIKAYIPHGNIVFGVSYEPYVEGFDGQTQFRMLDKNPVVDVAQKIASSDSPRSLTVLEYSQETVDDVIRMLRPRHLVIVRGSYRFAFHRRSIYRLLTKRHIPFELISPFVDEVEARRYEHQIISGWDDPVALTPGDDMMMFDLADQISHRSFDYCFQTGCVLSTKSEGGMYQPIVATYNQVIPFHTYALHYGSAREENLSDLHDTNHYDTIHAEMAALVQMTRQPQGMQNLTLHIGLLPCPNCARTLSQTGLREVVYRLDHSDGYAADLFSKCNIIVRKAEEL